MQVVPPELDLRVVVDQDAEPVDWDQVLARFLLNYVRKHTTSAGPPAAERSISTTGDERHDHGSTVSG